MGEVSSGQVSPISFQKRKQFWSVIRIRAGNDIRRCSDMRFLCPSVRNLAAGLDFSSAPRYNKKDNDIFGRGGRFFVTANRSASRNRL